MWGGGGGFSLKGRVFHHRGHVLSSFPDDVEEDLTPRHPPIPASYTSQDIEDVRAES